MLASLFTDQKLEYVQHSFSDVVQKAEILNIGKAPASSKGYLRLHANENPFPLPRRVREKVYEAFEDLFHYPEDDSASLREVAANVYGVKKEQVIAANGSSEILSLIYRTFLSPGDVMGMLTPGFGYNEKLAISQGATLHRFELNEDFSFPIEELTSEYANSMKFIVIANPNNPTGTFVPTSTIEDVLNKVNCLVVVDEAYIDFASDSSLRLVDQYPNLLVLRSFSKSYAVAGARIGLGFGHPNVIENIMKFMSMFNLNIVGQTVGVSILENLQSFEPLHEIICQQRGRVSRELEILNFNIIPSYANFILARVPENSTAAEWSRLLRKRKILVGTFTEERLKEYIRITITTERQMDIFIDAVKSIDVANSKKPPFQGDEN